MAAPRHGGEAVMFSISLPKAASTRRYLITLLSDAGWEVTREREGEITGACRTSIATTSYRRTLLSPFA